ncbi:hypothetical protein H6F67_10550 [Microcoleus sp. FACHB-1515]|uniref:hypothetical protein n=1 Tax=Cyanophyceae TaxID=3028117 RepID=UPI001688F6E6|nr:hypothetical protein [Microcoleus sp. FACHB-1515]MBD2090292.1 hypothetical protein [Microcoleus sp. FACHB-1515]
MAEEFLSNGDANVPPIDPPVDRPKKRDTVPGALRDRREAVRIIVVGSDPAITNIIYTLFVKEFAEIYEWSDSLPEPNTGKLMRVVTKYVNLD